MRKCARAYTHTYAHTHTHTHTNTHAPCVHECFSVRAYIHACMCACNKRMSHVTHKCRVLEENGVDMVFLPTSAMIYPPEFDTWVMTDVGTGRNEGAVSFFLFCLFPSCFPLFFLLSLSFSPLFFLFLSLFLFQRLHNSLS